jgi:hypothetical protein
MTMLIELDSDNRASLRRLFDRYPCLHGSVAAVIEGGMGRVFADAQEEPCVALAVFDFHFLAGDPLHPNALPLFKLLQPGDVVVAPTPAWQRLVAATYPSALAVYRREAFQLEQAKSTADIVSSALAADQLLDRERQPFKSTKGEVDVYLSSSFKYTFHMAV